MKAGVGFLCFDIDPAEATMGLLHMLVGRRVRDAGGTGGMLLVMLALAGLLTKAPARQARSPRGPLNAEGSGEPFLDDGSSGIR